MTAGRKMDDELEIFVFCSVGDGGEKLAEVEAGMTLAAIRMFFGVGSWWSCSSYRV